MSVDRTENDSQPLRVIPRRARPHLRLDAPLRRDVILALALLFCYGFFRQQPAWNEYSRYDLVQALVNDGTTSIDPYQDNTGDKAYYNGHFYSDKTPGTALLGVPVDRLLALTYAATGAGVPDSQAAIQALAFGVSGIPTALLVLLMLRFLRRAVGEGWALVISVGYGLGSIAFPFATMFFGHAASAFFLFSSFYVLWRAQSVERPTWLPVLAGFLAGWAVVVELSTVLGVMALLAYALSNAQPTGRRLARLNWRAPALMIAGATLPAAVLLGYNWLSFGGPFSLGYTNLEAGGFAEGMGRGILGISWPSASVLADLLFGPRGLLRLAPWFILAPVGLLAARRREIRREVLVCGTIVVGFLAFNAGYYLPFGGWTPGPRFLVPALPFAAVLVAVAPRAFRPFVAFTIAVAVALMFAATVTMPNAPELYLDPLTQLWLPRLLNRDIGETIAWLRWGLHGIQPLIVLVLALAGAGAAILATFQPGAAARRLTGVLAAALVLLVVAFALPLVPIRAMSLAVGNSPTPPVNSIAIVEEGGTPVRTTQEDRSVMWAQMENRGPELGGTRVVYTVFTTDGTQTWSGWYDNVSWSQGERKRLAIDWDTSRVPRGDYRLEVAVMSEDQTMVYSSGPNSSPVSVRP